MEEERKDSGVVDLVIDDETVPSESAEAPAEEPKMKAPEEEPKAEESAEELKRETPEEEPKAEVSAGEPKAETSAEGTKATIPAEEPKTEGPVEEPKAEGAAEEPKAALLHELSGIGHQEAFVDQKAFEKKKKVRHALIAALITLGALFVVGYFVMVILCTRYFQPNTVINGVDYSFRSADSVQREFDAKKEGYELHVTLRDGEFSVKAEDIGLVVTTAKDVQRIKDEQNPFLWFMAFFDGPGEAAYVISYDKDMLKAYLDNVRALQPENMVQPENPKIIFEKGKPVIRAGKKGTLLDTEKVYRLVEERVKSLNSDLNLMTENCYINADYDVDSEKVVKLRDTLEIYTGLKVTYLYGENARFTLRPEDIYNMMEIDEEKYYCAVSRKKVESFVAEFAYEHDTFGRERLFRTHFGKIAHLTSSYLGWEIDQEKEVDELIQNLVRKENIEREPMLLHRGNVYTQNGSDIGNSYVELDLTVQKVYFYMGGQLILEDDIISGNPNKYQNTPGGFYEIYGMRQNVVLTGPGYASHVDYWMPFNGEIGLHDAYWQSKFGGNLYLTRGSHGCVNLPFNTAQTIYEMGYRGLPVICYWRDDSFFRVDGR